MTAEWLINRMGLKNAKFTEKIPDSLGGNIGHALNFAGQTVDDAKRTAIYHECSAN